MVNLLFTKPKKAVTFPSLLNPGFIFVRPKKAWIRIFEAVLAIFIVTSVVLVLYSRQTTTSNPADYFSGWGDRIMSDISYNDSLRNAIFLGDNNTLSPYISSNLPANFGFEVDICNLDVSDYCRLREVVRSDVFATEKIFGSNITEYSPKRVKLFIWEK